MGKQKKLSAMDRRDLRQEAIAVRIVHSQVQNQIYPDDVSTQKGTIGLSTFNDNVTKSRSTKKDTGLAGLQIKKPQANLAFFFQNGDPTPVTPEQLRVQKYALAMSKRNAHRRQHAAQGTQKTLYGAAARIAIFEKKTCPYFNRSGRK